MDICMLLNKYKLLLRKPKISEDFPIFNRSSPKVETFFLIINSS